LDQEAYCGVNARSETSPAGAGEVEGAKRTRVRVIGRHIAFYVWGILLRSILLRGDPITLTLDASHLDLSHA
jgi:hypothetical protein